VERLSYFDSFTRRAKQPQINRDDGQLNHRSTQLNTKEVIMKNHNSYSLAVNRQLAGAQFARAKLALLFLFAMLLFSVGAYADTLYFYGGDFNPNDPNADALANETDGSIGGSPYGAATFQNFKYTAGDGNISALFSNNLANYVGPQSAYYEIHMGTSQGVAGPVVASGTENLGPNHFTWAPTGRSGFGYTEWQALVGSTTGAGLNISLPGSGTYWFAVVPNDGANSTRSFNTNTFSLGSVGNETNDLQFFDSASLGANFDNADNWGVFPTFSSGVWVNDQVPEPSSLVLVGSGLLGVAGILRRQWSA
jgi:hypothetical protein